MTLSRSFKIKKKKIRNFTPNELKIAYKGKKSKIIKVCVFECFSPKCLFRSENWFFEKNHQVPIENSEKRHE